MRILLSSNHSYPASPSTSKGRHPMTWPSGSGGFVHDLIAKGLAELGHDVFYLLKEGANQPLPVGVTLVSEPRTDVDIFHCITYRDEDIVQYMEAHQVPWVATCHLDLRARGRKRSFASDNWIFVSKTLAHSLGKSRYVLNGIDPEQYLYCETKEDYIAFMASADYALDKGLDIALKLSQEYDVNLVVAGTGKTYGQIETVARLCDQAGATYLGDVRGKEKSQFLGKAKAVICPTKVNEAFGLVMAEALMSGTPALCSDKGAYPELVSPDVGFICTSEQDYVDGLKRLDEISPQACRNKAMQRFHYLQMAKNYLQEYQHEISKVAS